MDIIAKKYIESLEKLKADIYVNCKSGDEDYYLRNTENFKLPPKLDFNFEISTVSTSGPSNDGPHYSNSNWLPKTLPSTVRIACTPVDTTSVAQWSPTLGNYITQIKNERVTMIFTPSNFCRDVLLTYDNLSVSKDNIKVIPFGINENIKYYNRPKKKKFTFLNVGVSHYRKGTDFIIDAYCTAFPKPENTRLIIKDHPPMYDGGWQGSKYSKGNSIIDTQLTEERKKRGDIIYIADMLDEKELLNLYYNADCYLSPHRGGSWELNTSDAMASGLPCIVTDWAGTTEYCNSENSYPMRYEIVPVNGKWYADARWAEPDKYHFVELMRHVYEHPKEAREKGKIASDFLLKNFTWEQSAKKILDVLTNHKPKVNVQEFPWA